MAQRLGCDPFEIIDMSSNVNPLGPLHGLVTFLKKNIKTIAVLPEVNARGAANAFASLYSIDPERVIPGNGTTQFIYSIPQVLETKRALILGPTYADYADACIMHNVHHDYLMAGEMLAFQPDIDAVIQHAGDYDAVFICNPNNPTGAMIPAADLKGLCGSHQNTYFVIDESYLPFADGSNKQSMIKPGLPNVMVLNSMSKFFTVPGLRIGFLISSLQIIEKFRPYILPWSVNSLAQAAVHYLMAQKAEVDTFIKKTAEFIEKEKKMLAVTFENASNIKLLPSTTSFVLARLYGNLTADIVSNHLSQHRILIRNCANFTGLSDHFIRISLKTSENNRMLAEKLLSLTSVHP